MDNELMNFGPDDEIVLREALNNQSKLLQQLCEELDEEREASSSAASEAMSMILRLQAEKASVAMEARQYRRMAEEKMQYAQESLAVFEHLMYKRKLEIKALEFQVQAFKHKLLSIGAADDVDLERRDEWGGQWSRRGEPRGKAATSRCVVEEEEDEDDGKWHNVKLTKIQRNSNQPTLKMRSLNSSSSSYTHSGKQGINGGSNKKIKSPHPWSTIKHLAIKEEEDDAIVEVRCESEADDDRKLRKGRTSVDRSRLTSDTGTLSCNSLSRFSSFHSAVCTDDDGDDGDIEFMNHSELARSGCSFTSCESEDGSCLSEGDSHFSIPGSESEAVKNNNGGVYDVFEVLKHPERESENCDALSDLKMDGEDRLNMVSVSQLYGTQIQLNIRLKQLEDERERMKQEDAQRRLQEFRLLKDICERLDTIQTQMKNHKREERNSRTDSSCVVSVMEAIFHCSL